VLKTHKNAIGRQNWVPVPCSKIHYLVPNMGNDYPVFCHDHTKYHHFGGQN